MAQNMSFTSATGGPDTRGPWGSPCEAPPCPCTPLGTGQLTLAQGTPLLFLSAWFFVEMLCFVTVLSLAVTGDSYGAHSARC